MPEYLAPGVYVEEFAPGPKPIDGVSTSTAGMVGQTERGPIRPCLVTSWLEYQQWFGGIVSDAFLPLAVQGFFENDGRRMFVARVTGVGATTATIDVPTSAAPLVLAAIGPGTWGNRLTARVDRGTLAKLQPPRDCFRLTILYDRAVVEDFDNLTVEPDSQDNVALVMNTHSRFVRIASVPASSPIDGDVAASGGMDDAPQVADFVGDDQQPPDQRTGLAALETISEISLLVVPDEVRDRTGAISDAVISQCERTKDRFAIVSAPGNLADINSIRVPRDTSYAAFYYPWLRVAAPAVPAGGAKQTVLVPPGGHVAGILARTDLERGVHKAPANEIVRGVDATDPLEFFISKSEQDILNPRGVNVIRDFRDAGRGVRVWGARTMSSGSELRYVNVRRLFIFIEESIDEGTQWVGFEPNTETTWALVRRAVTDFLRQVWLSGALLGIKDDEAYFVKCDRTTMTQDDIDNGRLICLIGIAPVKPAEFVIVRISQLTAKSGKSDP